MNQLQPPKRVYFQNSETGYRGGRPRIDGTRLTVAEIALLHLRMGQTPVEIAGRYDLPLAAVYAALAFYFDHRQAIDADIAADEAYAAEFRTANPHKCLSSRRNIAQPHLDL